MSSQSWMRYGDNLLADIDHLQPPEGTLAIWYLGQEGLVLKGAGMIVYVDPYLSDPKREDERGEMVSRRKFPPPFTGADITHADVVLGTHNHSDHMDLPTLKLIGQAAERTRFMVPAPHVEVLTELGIAAERVIPARAGEAFRQGPLTVTPIPAAHEELERDSKGDYMCLGYIVQLGGVTLYHAGDTVEYPDLISTLRKWELDVACLPINGRDLMRNRRNIIGNMNFREAVDVGHSVGAQLIIPLHYDVFAGNSENPAFFVDYLYRTYPAQAFKVMAPGERILYMP